MKLRHLLPGTLYQPKRFFRRTPGAVYEALGDGRRQGAGRFINGQLHIIPPEEREAQGYLIITGGEGLDMDVKIVRRPEEV